MAARTTDEILAQIERWLPGSYRALRPVLGGLAAATAQADSASFNAAWTGTVGGADGDWLTLLARGYGVRRLSGVADSELRYAIRHPADAVTRPALLAAVNRILAAYTATEAVMIEWFEGPYFDTDYFDWPGTLWLDGPNEFIIVIPVIGDDLSGEAYFDTDYFDDPTNAYFGSDISAGAYAAILEIVERLRAAGIRWWLVIDTTGLITG